MYSLEGEPGEVDAGTARHPRIVFSYQQPEKFEGIRILTGTAVSNQFPGLVENSLGQTSVSSRSDHEQMKIWIARIAGDGSVLVADKKIISDLVGHKRFVISFTSTSGEIMVDRYLTAGLSIKSLRIDCSALFPRR